MNLREKKTMELINTHKILSVSELCDNLQVSESTARRLFTNLSDKGLIRRFHGGGQSLSLFDEKTDVQKRIDDNYNKKDNIARYAAKMIKNGQSVMLMGGTTVYMMCKYIMDHKVTVITNSMIIYEELKIVPNIDLIILGGRYNHNEMEVRGALTSSGLRLLNSDFLFMGATGFNTDTGFLTYDIDSVELYHLCIDATNHCCVLADSSKVMGCGTAVMAPLDRTNILISDIGLSDENTNLFKEKGIDVIRI